MHVTDYRSCSGADFVSAVLNLRVLLPQGSLVSVVNPQLWLL